MKPRGSSVVEACDTSQLWPEAQQRVLRPGRLHLVSSHEVAELRRALARGVLPADLEAKLARLAKGELLHHFVEQNCRTMIALLLAAQDRKSVV